MSRETETTVWDVVDDTIAALDLYTGLYGSGETTILSTRPEYGKQAQKLDSLVVALSDGSEYRLTAERVEG